MHRLTMAVCLLVWGLSAGRAEQPKYFGPELQFGHVLGDHFDNQVLLIRTAWGGRSLLGDFRPPSSGGEVGPYYREVNRPRVTGPQGFLRPDSGWPRSRF